MLLVIAPIWKQIIKKPAKYIGARISFINQSEDQFRIIPNAAKFNIMTDPYKKTLGLGSENFGDSLTMSYLRGNPKKNKVIEEREIKIPNIKKVNFGSILNPKTKLANPAPIIPPTLKEDTKTGFKIFFVFDSTIATCVNILGAWIPTAIPQGIKSKKNQK